MQKNVCATRISTDVRRSFCCTGRRSACVTSCSRRAQARECPAAAVSWLHQLDAWDVCRLAAAAGAAPAAHRHTTLPLTRPPSRTPLPSTPPATARQRVRLQQPSTTHSTTSVKLKPRYRDSVEENLLLLYCPTYHLRTCPTAILPYCLP